MILLVSSMQTSKRVIGEKMLKNSKLKINMVGLLSLATTLAVTAVPAVSYANAQILDFKSCVNTALAQNPEVEASSARIQQAQAALSKAELSRMPEITLSVTGSRSNDALNVFGMKLQQRQASIGEFGIAESGAFLNPTTPNASYEPEALNKPGAYNNINTRIEMLLPVWNGGKISNYQDQAAAMIEAARNGDLAVQQYLTFNIYQAYEAVHAARAYITVAKQALETADSYVKTTRNLVDQGVVVRSEFLSAKVNQSSAQVALTKAKSQEKIALQTLKMLMNISASANIDVAERLDLSLPVSSEEELLSLAMDSNPELDAKRKLAEASSYDIKVAKADYYPSFNMMLRKDWNDDALALNNSSYTVAGVFSWKLTDFGVTQSSVDMASADAAHKKAVAKSQENRVRIEVLTAWNKLQAAEQQVLANILAVEQADEARRLVLKRYNNGIATITELLASNTQLDRARAELVSARYDVNVQKAKLLLATGRMDVSRL